MQSPALNRRVEDLYNNKKGDSCESPFDLLTAAVGVWAPIGQIDSAGGLSTVDHESLHRQARVDICALQVVTWCPGVGIVNSVGQQNAVVKIALRDGELDRLACGCVFKEQC